MSSLLEPIIHFIWKLSPVFLFLCLATLGMRKALRRKRLGSKLPGAKVRFLSIWGDLENIQRNLPQGLLHCYNTFMLQLFSAYTQEFREKKIFLFWFSFIPTVFIVKSQAVEELISGSKNLEKGWGYKFLHPWLSSGLLTSHGKKWKSRRKLLTPTFHFDILKDFLPIMNEKSLMLVDILRKETQKDWTDIPQYITLCTLDIICETTLGVCINAQQNSKSEYVEAIGRVSSIPMRRCMNPFYLVDWIFNCSKMGRQFQKDVKLLHNFTRSVIREKKAEILQGGGSAASRKRKAFMHLLLEHHIADGNLSEEDIREEVDTFTFGGHDTTSAGISWALYLIGLYKEVQSNIHEELDRVFGNDVERHVTTDDLKDLEYLDRVIKESQRLYPSAPMVARRCSAETVINGYEIPEGTTCLILIYEVHRDPEVFPDPEKFDPDRFLPENTSNRHPYAYIPFSAGPRNCIGQRFGIMEEKVILANILRTFSVESLEQRDKVMTSPEIVLRPAMPLKIRIRYRNS